MIIRRHFLINLNENFYLLTFAILILFLNAKQAYSNASILDNYDDNFSNNNIIRVNLTSSKFSKINAPLNANTPRKESDNDDNMCADFNISSSVLQNNTEECRKQLRESIYGPQHKSLPFVICLSAVYILILVCGFTGNLSTCYVIITNSCMHTTTNYYLFSLAVSDVLSLVTGLPVELYTIIVEAYPWAFGETFCIIRTFLFETTTIASVLTILTFTFERWLHICKAIYAQKFSSGFSRALKIIVFIWVFSGTISLPYVFTTGVYVDSEDFPETRTCNTQKIYLTPMTTMIQLSVLFLFIVPMSLIIIMYILIGITLWKSSKNHKFHGVGAKQLRRCIKTEIVHKHIDNTSASNTLNVPSSGNHVKRDVSLPVLKHFSAIKNGKKHHLSESNSTSINNRINGNERTSKDFENFAYKNRQSRRDVVKMLFFVVLGFFLCWAPFHAQRVLAIQIQNQLQNSTSDSKILIKLLEYLYYVSGISIYISSTLNPILYNVMSKRYRTAFKNTLKMLLACKKPNQSFKAQTYYSNYYNTLNNKANVHSRKLQSEMM